MNAKDWICRLLPYHCFSPFLQRTIPYTFLEEYYIFTSLSTFPVIYYHSLAVEMFLISIFARYSFRRAEPQPDAQQLTRHQGSQTEGALSRKSSPADDTSMGGRNPAYLCDETICTIEHSPLDRLDFIAGESVDRQQERRGPGSRHTEELRPEGRKAGLPPQKSGVNLLSNRIQIQAQVSNADTDGVTVV